MLIKKYNRITKTYEELFECDTKLITKNFDELIECPYCHKKVRFGDTYNTGDYYDLSGLWRVGICEDCAKEIWEKERKD